MVKLEIILLKIDNNATNIQNVTIVAIVDNNKRKIQ